MYNKLSEWLHAFRKRGESTFDRFAIHEEEKTMLMTFGEAMLQLIKSRGLSATAVAEELGFKNRTAFFRILHDESRMPSIEKCFEAAKRSDMLALTPEEIDQLTTAMSVSELGRQAYGMSTVLHRMLHPARKKDAAPDIIVEGIEGVKNLEDILGTLSSGGRLRITLLGRCRKSILDRFHRLTQEMQVTKIIHMFAIDEEDAEDVKVFAEVSDILFSGVYSAYYLNETNVSMKKWWLRSAIILLFYEDEQGKKTTLQLTWLGADRYLGGWDESGGVMRFWNGMIQNVRDQLVPLKKESGEVEANVMPDIQRYIEFTDEFRKLEQNRAIYMIKPDFPINCVPAEIIAPLIRGGFMNASVDAKPEMVAQFTKLYEIHKSRVEKLYEKKKETHIVFSEQAMMRFAKTGRRSDHFFLCRPYTRDERVCVLSLLRDQTRDNPNFNIWFSRRSDIVDDKEVTIYDGYGVAMIKADTSWHLEHDHQEIMLESRMLVQHFKSYFLKSILGKEVMTKEESIALLEEMIEAAKTA